MHVDGKEAWRVKVPAEGDHDSVTVSQFVVVTVCQTVTSSPVRGSVCLTMLCWQTIETDKDAEPGGSAFAREECEVIGFSLCHLVADTILHPSGVWTWWAASWLRAGTICQFSALTHRRESRPVLRGGQEQIPDAEQANKWRHTSEEWRDEVMGGSFEINSPLRETLEHSHSR